MTKAAIIAEIAEYEDLLKTPGIPPDEQEIAQEQLADLRAQLAKLDSATPPAEAKNPAKRVRKSAKVASKPKYEAGMSFVADGERLEIIRFESPFEGENFYLVNSSDYGQDEKSEKSITAEIKKLGLKREKQQSHAAFTRELKARDKAAKTKRPKKSADPYTGVHLDRDGHPLAVGDTVEVTVKDRTYEARLTSLRKLNGGGYGVKFVRDGTTLTFMLQPSAIRFVSSGSPEGVTVTHAIALPANLVKKAKRVKRKDCDEQEAGILVTPTEKVVVDAPQIADPAHGDKILAHPDGTPVAVIEGAEVEKHFETVGTVKVETGPDGTVSFDESPEAEAAEQQKDKAETPDKKIKPVKPPVDCTFLKTEEGDANALQTFLEGMRQRWKSLDTHDKILRVWLRKSDSRVVIEIKRYNLIDFPIGTKYYSICLNTGKLTQTDKPERGAATILHSEHKMRDFYRFPNANSCRRASRELYVTCYRDGECDQAKRKRLLEIVNTNCRHRENEMSRSYRKYVHEKTADRWKGYKGDKSYYQVYAGVIADLKAGKKV